MGQSILLQYLANPQSISAGASHGLQGDVVGNLKVTLATKVDAVNDKVTTRAEGNANLSISASTLLRTGTSILKGYIIASHTAGATIKFWDSAAASGTVLMDTFTTTATTSVGVFLPLGDLLAGTGIYCSITGTIVMTPVWIDPTIF